MNFPSDFSNIISAIMQIIAALITLKAAVIGFSSQKRKERPETTTEAKQKRTATKTRDFWARYLAAQFLIFWASGVLLYIMFSSRGGQPLTGWSGGMLALAVIQIFVAFKLREDA